jgi:hypothetical protein
MRPAKAEREIGSMERARARQQRTIEGRGRARVVLLRGRVNFKQGIGLAGYPGGRGEAEK